jgi:hypothetical protein
MRSETTTGLLLIGLGALFLVGRYIGGFAWPLFVIVPGVALLVWAFAGGASTSGLAIPGSIVTTVGLILYLQNATSSFHSWAYAWGLVVASEGAGRYLTGMLQGDVAQQQSGTRTAASGLALFAAFGLFFELLIFGGLRGTWLGEWGVPLALILAGTYLIYRRRSPDA